MFTIPQITPRHTSRPAFGFDARGQLVSDVSADALRAIYTALLQSIEERLRAEKASLEAIQEAHRAGAQAWFDLLNATVGEGALFSDAWIKGTMHMYSTEIFYLAGDYARQIVGDDSNFMRHLVSQLAPRQLRDVGKALSLGQLYEHHETLFQNIAGIDLRIARQARNSVVIQWHATSTLAKVAPGYRVEFARYMRLVILTMLQQVPTLLKNGEPANVVQRQIDDTITEWVVNWEQPLTIPIYALGGIAVSVVVFVLEELLKLSILDYLVLLPAFLGIAWQLYTYMKTQSDLQTKAILDQIQFAQLQTLELNTAYANLRDINIAREKQVNDLSAVREAVLGLITSFDQNRMLDGMVEVMTDLLRFDRAMVLLRDQENRALVFGSISHPPNEPDDLMRLGNLRIDLEDDDPINQNDPLLGSWLRGESLMVLDPSFYFNSRLNWALALLEFNNFYSVPLTLGNNMLGVMVVDNIFTRVGISEESRSLMDALATNIAIAMENARLYHLQDEQLQKNVGELRIMEQVDRELVDTLDIDSVLELLLDWALRFTNARVATITLYDEAVEVGNVAAFYGCAESELPGGRKEIPIPVKEGGITGRAAREGRIQVVDDVSSDPDYRTIISTIHATVAVPIKRQNRVVAVMTIENEKKAGFAPEHVTFIQRLANRAGVALENARLYTETQKERNKLSSILIQTSDAVIVVDEKHEMVLLNNAALRIFNLEGSPETYAGKDFRAVFINSTLLDFYAEVKADRHEPHTEVQVGEMTYDANAVLVEGVGYTILLHDVTPFKELDRLKNELVSSVSHDLKNPLAVMKGYVDLLDMTQNFNDKGSRYIINITQSIDGMRELIDNILDLAKIDSGVQLQFEEVDLGKEIVDVEDENMLRAKEKGVVFVNRFDEALPPVNADLVRIKQILNNLISNAVKYTLEASEVIITAQLKGELVYILVEDHGIGISAEDIETIWDRFVRVRNEKTKNIDGTGLGLSIVKSLVEAHGGTVNVVSREQEGSTFSFTLPINQPPKSDARDGILAD